MQEAYEEGRDYFTAGINDCPHPEGSSGRIAFWDGWYDQKHANRLGHLPGGWDFYTQEYWSEQEPAETV